MLWLLRLEVLIWPFIQLVHLYNTTITTMTAFVQYYIDLIILFSVIVVLTQNGSLYRFTNIIALGAKGSIIILIV